MTMSDSSLRVAVIGSGSWGTALANILALNGHDTLLWSYDAELVEEINQRHVNPIFLPDIPLCPSLSCTSSLAEALENRKLVLLVAPVQATRSVLMQAIIGIEPDSVVVNASKGIELETLKTISQICMDFFGDNFLDRYVALSGPTFAREVARGFPSLIVAASRNPSCSLLTQSALSNSTFRVYTNTDVTGTELGGAVKNVIAIAAGICDGLGFGYNPRAALITRGLAEMNRLGVAMGANPATFAGLAGMGDLVLTCTGDLSRNRTIGFKLGQGMRLADILSEMRMVAEGVKTAESVYQLSRNLKVEMPIVEKVYQILHEDKPAKEAVIELMSRALKTEG